VVGVLAAAVVGATAGAATAPHAWRVPPRGSPLAQASRARRGRTCALVAVQALAAALVAARVGWDPVLAGLMVAEFSSVWLSAVDLHAHRLPAFAVYAATALVLCLLVLAALAGHEPRRALAVCAGAAALRLVYQAVSVGLGGIGAGDVRLSSLLGAVGAWGGWHGWILATALPFVTFAAVGMAINAIRGQHGGALPFGPAMALGLLAVVVLAG